MDRSALLRQPMATRQRSVLVVDDDPQSILLVGSLLNESGYRIHVADSGELALAIAKEVPIDLVLLDILLLPPQMDGIETCHRLKACADTRPIPVIFLTGKEDEETMVRAFEVGGADYVNKPFNAQVLLARVRAHTELGLLTRQQERALAERTRELSEANTKLRKLAMDVSLIEAREKKRLASNLHDSPMQKLALARMQIASAGQCHDSETTQLLESGLELLDDTLHELRFLQFELSPPLLYQEGLAVALQWLATHALQHWGVVVSFVGSAPFPRLSTDLSVILFQFARELVCNVIKHAAATQAWIDLRTEQEILHLEVKDNGLGFRDSSVDEHSGYGLFSIRERVSLLGGDLLLESHATGTRIAVRIPLNPGAS